MDARGWESDSQHVLLCGDVLLAGDAVQITHVAEREGGREEKESLTAALKSVSVVS